MSLITRCPTCETMFRVVPDQLRVSEGWVRCGQCAAVFDATQNMVPPPDAPGFAVNAPAQKPAPNLASPPVAAPTPKAAAAEPAVAADRVEDGGIASDIVQASATPAMPLKSSTIDDAPAAEPIPAAASSLHSDDTSGMTSPIDPDDDWMDAPLTDPQTIIQAHEDDFEEAIDTLPPPEPEMQPGSLPHHDHASAPEAAIAKPSFLRNDAKKASVWRRPGVRIVLVILVLVLLALLGAQILIKERNRVAAVQPALRPILQALCVVAGCRVAPLRQIESIVIDSSSFSRVRDDTYHLGFALKNTAPIDVAMPAIELSLTDPQDQPVIRRVILPAEFGARSAVLAHSAVWNGSMALTVQTDTGAKRIAGYRLLAFYP